MSPDYSKKNRSSTILPKIILYYKNIDIYKNNPFPVPNLARYKNHTGVKEFAVNGPDSAPYISSISEFRRLFQTKEQ